VRFRAALDARRAAAATELGFGERARRALELVWPRRPALQLAFSAAMLVVGLVAGATLDPDHGTRGEVRALREELNAMNRTVAVALLEHGSASERLRGVELGRRSVDDRRVTAALIDTVRHDPNVNVRLAAVEALTASLDRPEVGRALVDTLPHETSPYVQLALAETLVEARVDGADRAIRELLRRPEDAEPLDDGVRESLSELMKEVG
jgi:hypothetical protein